MPVAKQQPIVELSIGAFAICYGSFETSALYVGVRKYGYLAWLGAMRTDLLSRTKCFECLTLGDYHRSLI